MAAVIQNPEQVEALERINRGLSDVKAMDYVIERAAGCPLCIAVDENAGKRNSGNKVVIPDKMTHRVLSIILQVRANTCKDIMALGKKFAIGFDAEEQALLNKSPTAVEKVATASEKYREPSEAAASDDEAFEADEDMDI